MACVDALEVFEAAEAAFDAVALFVCGLIVGVRIFARWIGRDDRLGSVLGKPCAQGSCVIGMVGEQVTGRSGDGHQVARAAQIVGSSRRQPQSARPPQRVGQCVNLGGTSAVGSADSLRQRPPFARDAERCALMCMLSIEAVTPPIMPNEPIRA